MSNRNLPEQFGRGLTLDGNRIEKNLRKMGSLTQVPEHLVKQRMHPSWLVWGLQSDLKIVNPQPGPWLRETNTNDVSPTYDAPTIKNPFRHKGVATPGIDLTSSNYLTWEVTFASTTPIRINKFAAWLIVDGDYINDFLYGAPNPPPTKTTGDPLDDMSVSLWCADNLDPEDRTRTSIEAGSFKWSFGKFKLWNDPAFIPTDTMQPPHPAGAAKGVCLEVDCQVDLPAGRYGLSVTIPDYDSVTYKTGWLDNSWKRQVWSVGVQVQEGAQ